MMTHEELLKHLWEKRNSLCDHLDVHFALSAVVELHKPIKTTPPWEYEWYLACSACENYTNDGAYFLEYPCPTIQAIEKAL